MKRFKTVALAALTLSLAAGGFAVAQQTTPTNNATPAQAAPVDQGTANDLPPSAKAPENTADAMRRERHGAREITKDEFAAKRMERLKAADTNGDGILSKEEIEAMVLKEMVERRAARLERRLDTDGDGKVTLAEVERMRDKRFQLADRNDDGKLDRRELWRLHREMAANNGHGRPMWHHDGGRGWNRGHGMQNEDENRG